MTDESYLNKYLEVSLHKMRACGQLCQCKFLPDTLYVCERKSQSVFLCRCFGCVCVCACVRGREKKREGGGERESLDCIQTKNGEKSEGRVREGEPKSFRLVQSFPELHQWKRLPPVIFFEKHFFVIFQVSCHKMTLTREKSDENVPYPGSGKRRHDSAEKSKSGSKKSRTNSGSNEDKVKLNPTQIEAEFRVLQSLIPQIAHRQELSEVRNTEHIWMPGICPIRIVRFLLITKTSK